MEMAADSGHLGVVESLANIVGAKEEALRLLLSLFGGYPLAVFYRLFLYGRAANLQHIYFIICGLGICYFNFGGHVIHSIANILLIYILLLTLGGSALSVVLAFIINMTYLCTGYFITMTESYSISWTMPHCVLALRLIGVVFDVYDGRQKPDTLSPDRKETALLKGPSLLELAAHTFYFGGFLVGPQFPLKRFRDFVGGAFSDSVTGGKPASIRPALVRLAAGLAYTAVYQLSVVYLPDSFLLSSQFKELSFLYKCLVISLWGKLMLYKYFACWMTTEGVCILTGMTYNGKDENGNDLWDGCSSLNIINYEKATSSRDFIESFNINTNKWVGKYVFKRLKFIGNKNISHVSTLFFLAIWHGIYSGYFVNFSIEFFMVKFEIEAVPFMSKTKLVRTVHSMPGGSLLIWLVKKFYAVFVLSYALVSFSLFTFKKYWEVYWSVYLVVHVFCVGWTVIAIFLKPSLKSSSQDGLKKKN